MHAPNPLEGLGSPHVDFLFKQMTVFTEANFASHKDLIQRAAVQRAGHVACHMLH